MTRLSGKRVLITAAGNGIGRACALAACREGADVLATDIDQQALEQLVEDANCDRLAIRQVDGTQRFEIEALAQESEPFDSIIHCIGIVHHGDLLSCDANDWLRSFTINVDSFYHVAQLFIPGMQTRGRGSIVCISSIASSLKGLPNRAAYGATKGALNGMVKSIASDFVGNGIRCNAVCPGTISTPSLKERMTTLGKEVGGFEAAHDSFVSRQPMKRIGTPEEVAALCIYLASDESAFITGQLLAIDGGISI